MRGRPGVPGQARHGPDSSEYCTLRGVTLGATLAVAEVNTPFRYHFRYPALATVFHESRWHCCGSFASSRTGVSAFGRRVGLGATPPFPPDVQPRNPDLCKPFCYLLGVAPSLRLRRKRSLREGYPGVLAPPASRSSWSTSGTRPAPLTISITTACAAFPGSWDVPILAGFSSVHPRERIGSVSRITTRGSRAVTATYRHDRTLTSARALSRPAPRADWRDGDSARKIGRPMRSSYPNQRPSTTVSIDCGIVAYFGFSERHNGSANVRCQSRPGNSATLRVRWLDARKDYPPYPSNPSGRA